MEEDVLREMQRRASGVMPKGAGDVNEQPKAGGGMTLATAGE